MASQEMKPLLLDTYVRPIISNVGAAGKASLTLTYTSPFGHFCRTDTLLGGRCMVYKGLMCPGLLDTSFGETHL